MRCYTYVDKDVISRKIARTTLLALQQQYTTLLSDAAIQSFDKRLPQNISLCLESFLSQLMATNGRVDLLGGSSECQGVNRGGRQRCTMDSRFRFFYDLVRVINFFQRVQPTPMFYTLENTYPGKRCTAAVQKVSDLVQAFIGAAVLVDGAYLGGGRRTTSDSFRPTCCSQQSCKLPSPLR